MPKKKKRGGFFKRFFAKKAGGSPFRRLISKIPFVGQGLDVVAPVSVEDGKFWKGEKKLIEDARNGVIGGETDSIDDVAGRIDPRMFQQFLNPRPNLEDSQDEDEENDLTMFQKMQKFMIEKPMQFGAAVLGVLALGVVLIKKFF